jgi:hypothetical protein
VSVGRPNSLVYSMCPHTRSNLPRWLLEGPGIEREGEREAFQCVLKGREGGGGCKAKVHGASRAFPQRLALYQPAISGVHF